MKIKTEYFLGILKHLRLVFQDNNYTKESNFIFVDADKNLFYCYDDKIFCAEEYEGDLQEELCLPHNTILKIPAKDLYQLINRIKKEYIELEFEEDTKDFTIRNGRSTSTFSLETTASRPEALSRLTECDKEIPNTLDHLYRRYTSMDKEDRRSANIIFEKGFMVSSDIYRFTRVKVPITKEFVIKWDVLKYALSNKFEKYNVSPDVVNFTKGRQKLMCVNDTSNKMEYEEFFEEATSEEEFNPSKCVHWHKDEDIDFIDAFLLNYKKLDKKIDIEVTPRRVFLTAKGDGGNRETKSMIKINKYEAREKFGFPVNSDYFKDMYENFDYFALVCEDVLYCVNEKDGVERILSVAE